ncbi:MAG: ATP-binding protein [archaeon]
MVFFLSLCISVATASFLEIAKFYLKNILNITISSGDHQFAMVNLSFVFMGSFISNFASYFYLTQLRGKIFKGVVKKLRAENPNLFIARSKVVEDAKKTISLGEGERVEFKSSLRMNLHTGKPDLRVEHAVLKSVSSFLNSEGGFLFIGVSGKSEVLGLGSDGFENLDLFNRHLTNLIKENIGAEYLPYLGFDFFKIEEKVILRISCMKSSRPVFLKFEGREDFYIRIGASCILLLGNKMIGYIQNKFNNK